MKPEPVRCSWCLGDELYLGYHDQEWGVPLHDDRMLFEFLVLEGAQAGPVPGSGGNPPVK